MRIVTKALWAGSCDKKDSLGSCDVRELGLSRWRCDAGETRQPPRETRQSEHAHRPAAGDGDDGRGL
eukprot:6514396-Prymnesium_polylepis.1